MTEPLRSAFPGEPGTRADEATLRVVAARLAQRARDYGVPAGARTVTLRPFGDMSSYPLYVGEIASGAGDAYRVMIKFAPVFGEHHEGRAEYANLRVMNARLEPSGCLRVPRPLDYWEDVNALVTEHCPGARFATRILSTSAWLSPPRARRALAKSASRCGEWLRIYHDATSRGEGPAIDERYVNIVRRDLSRLPHRGPLRDVGSRIDASLDSIVAALSKRTAPVSIRHGDFSPDNVHVNDDGICVFDLSHHVAAPVHDDITFFLVTLDTMNPYPRYVAFDRRMARRLASPFLDGYYGADRERRERDESALLGAYALKNLLTRCLKQRRTAAAAGTLALAAFDRLWVAGLYHDLIEGAIDRATGDA